MGLSRDTIDDYANFEQKNNTINYNYTPKVFNIDF